jgi:hypothetical protein
MLPYHNLKTYVVLLHFPLVSGQGRLYPLMLASDSESLLGEYPHGPYVICIALNPAVWIVDSVEEIL